MKPKMIAAIERMNGQITSENNPASKANSGSLLGCDCRPADGSITGLAGGPDPYGPTGLGGSAGGPPCALTYDLGQGPVAYV